MRLHGGQKPKLEQQPASVEATQETFRAGLDRESGGNYSLLCSALPRVIAEHVRPPLCQGKKGTWCHCKYKEHLCSSMTITPFALRHPNSSGISSIHAALILPQGVAKELLSQKEPYSGN